MIHQNIRQNMIFYLIAVVLALAVKQHYSQARPEDLDWILKPTAGLVAMVSGETFVHEIGAGYACHSGNVIIAPACAGVNFMLMAFGMAVFAGLPHLERRRYCLAWLVFSLLVSYLLTLAVNTLRIMVSIQTLDSGLVGIGPAWDRVHRIQGVIIYFFFLYLFYSMIQKIIHRYAARRSSRKLNKRAAGPIQSRPLGKLVCKGCSPCVWYLTVTLVVPFLNRAAGKYGSLFFEHAAMVISLCLMTWLCIVVIEFCGQGIRLFFTGGFHTHEIQNPDC